MNTILDKDIDLWTAFVEQWNFRVKRAIPGNEKNIMKLRDAHKEVLDAMRELKKLYD